MRVFVDVYICVAYGYMHTDLVRPVGPDLEYLGLQTLCSRWLSSREGQRGGLSMAFQSDTRPCLYVHVHGCIHGGVDMSMQVCVHSCRIFLHSWANIFVSSRDIGSRCWCRVMLFHICLRVCMPLCTYWLHLCLRTRIRSQRVCSWFAARCIWKLARA